MARKGNLLIAIVSLCLLGLVGCAAETGLKAGLTKGLTDGLSALIKAPVDVFIDDTFGG